MACEVSEASLSAADSAVAETGADTAGDTGQAEEYDLIRDGKAEMVKPALRDRDRWKNARCNDGTPFGMEVVLPLEPSTTWVIFLGPGASCDDNADLCASRLARQPELTTTPPAEDEERYEAPFGGIFSEDEGTNPAFAKANRVYAQYCSSDLWTGDTIDPRPAADGQHWYFSGHANVDAMMDVLIERYGLDDEKPLDVLFTGSSAGGLGAHFNARRVAARVPNAVNSERFKVLIDAGWMVAWDDERYRDGRATESDLEVRRAAREFWGGKFDPVCEDAEASDPASCFFGATWYPHLAADFEVLVQQSGTDAAFTADHGIDPGDTQALQVWNRAVLASFADAEVGWLFSGQQSYHTLEFRDDGLKFGPPGDQFGDVIGRFWAGGEPERVIFGP